MKYYLKKSPSDLIKEIRRKTGLTDKEIGELLTLAQSTVTRIKNGKLPDPPHSVWVKLVKFHIKRKLERVK